MLFTFPDPENVADKTMENKGKGKNAKPGPPPDTSKNDEYQGDQNQRNMDVSGNSSGSFTTPGKDTGMGERQKTPDNVTPTTTDADTPMTTQGPSANPQVGVPPKRIRMYKDINQVTTALDTVGGRPRLGTRRQTTPLLQKDKI